MEEVAYAKINLALHVRGRMVDSFHDIETIFAFVEHGDMLRVEAGESLSLEVEGPFAGALIGEDDNLVMGAARVLREHCKVANGARMTLDKRLPVASGIGGGSADAAATLRLLDRFWQLNLGQAELAALGRRLGADVPACLASITSIGRGRGDDLIPADNMVQAGTPLLLVNPGVPVSTAEAFRRWHRIDGGPLPPDWRQGRNDLEASATAIAPQIALVLEELRAAGGQEARMSGSGATCFAFFESEADRDSAEARLSAAHPDWWLLSSRLR
jgi:4-diphosphocytidyl-2-C-methyl-D-erythritol kinase